MLQKAYVAKYSHLEELRSFQRPFYVRCSDSAEIEEVRRALKENPALQGVVVDAREPLCFFPFTEEWKDIDIVLRVSSIGSLRLVLSGIELLRSLRLRLCVGRGVTADEVKILSSAGVWCCLDYLSEPALDWDFVDSVADYALSRWPVERRIEPFAHLDGRYAPERGGVIPRCGFERFDMVADVDFVDGTPTFSGSSLPVDHDADDAEEDVDSLLERHGHAALAAVDEECQCCSAFKLCRGVAAGSVSTGRCRSHFLELMRRIETARTPAPAS